MQLALEFTDSLSAGDYSEIIDVRAPAEFAEDHLPGAINLPVLDDAERARVGALHKQHSPFAARRAGAALVAANIAAMLAGPLADRPPDYRPLIYCWRGGQRSRSLAIVLRQVGWQAVLLTGGYRRYRGWVRDQLERRAGSLRLLRIAGPTGSGKTELLRHLRRAGAQTLDLEHLAAHRGSVLGAEPDRPQPSQKYFESLLAEALRRLDPARPVWIESESSKIGRLHCPPALWRRMKAAPGVRLRAPVAARVTLLLDQYRHFVDDPAALKQQLAQVERHAGRRALDDWYTLIDQGRWPEFVADLLSRYYDRVYPQAGGARDRIVRAGDGDGATLEVALHDLDEATLAGWADRLARRYG